MTTKKKITPVKKKLKLPSLSDFELLPLSKRQRLFERWVATQPKKDTVTYYCVGDCPLARFGIALARWKRRAGGYPYIAGGNGFFNCIGAGNTKDDSVPYTDVISDCINENEHTKVLRECSGQTYGELSKRLRALRVSASSTGSEK